MRNKLRIFVIVLFAYIYIGIFSKWRKIEVVKWAEDAIYAPIQTVNDKNHSLR